MNRYSVLAACVLASFLAGGAAQAQNDSMVVRVGDLNVANTQGAQVAFQRIRSAARQFCNHGDSRNLGRIAEQRDCEGRMIGKAVHSLGAPMVMALYQSKPTVVASATR